MWAAFPQIAAFHTDMPPTILLPTALLFVCIDSRATRERCTNLLDNVMSGRLPRSRQQFFFFSFQFFYVENFAKFKIFLRKLVEVRLFLKIPKFSQFLYLKMAKFRQGKKH
jgi:hypothetical protein